MKEILCVPRITPREGKSKSLPAKGVILDQSLPCRDKEALMALNDGSFVAMMGHNTAIK